MVWAWNLVCGRFISFEKGRKNLTFRCPNYDVTTHCCETHSDRFRIPVLPSYWWGIIQSISHGRRKGRPPWIWKFQQEKLFFSFEWEKTFHHFWSPLEKFWKNSLVAPLQKILPTPMLAALQVDTKITVIIKNRTTSKILFRLTQNISYTRSSLCSRHLQGFKSVLQKLFVSLALKKCAPNELPGAAGTFGSGAQSSRWPPHSSLGIAFIAAVIAAFRSGIVWGLLPHTLSLRYPHI